MSYESITLELVTKSFASSQSSGLDSFSPPANSILCCCQQAEIGHEPLTFPRLESANAAGVVRRSADGDFVFDVHHSFEISLLLTAINGLSAVSHSVR
jgi:hypothetical protein